MLDVWVIGGGLAGSVAALAARAQGARVGCVARSWGATALSTGALDMAASWALLPVQQVHRSIVEHIQDVILHQPWHPFGVLGFEQTHEALEAGYRLLAQHVSHTGLDVPALDLHQPNTLLPSSLGILWPAATALAPHRMPDGMAIADVPIWGEGQRWGVVAMTSLDAHRWKLGWAHDAQALYGIQPDLVEIPVGISLPMHPMVLARALDDTKNVDMLAADLKSQIQGRGLTGLVMPPVLGLHRYADARHRLQTVLEIPILESLGHLPSVPGVRLQRILEAALKGAGVRYIQENAVSFSRQARRLTAVVTRHQTKLEAGAFVLATGRFIAGGLVGDGDATCREELLGLPLVTELGVLDPNSRQKVGWPTPVESHPWMTAGVHTNPQLLPVRAGEVVFENVYAAGMVMGGFSSRYALCADGVALATGWLAGQAAAS